MIFLNRINLEFSSNLARLIWMLHEDEAGCRRLLYLCYRHLPTFDLESDRVVQPHRPGILSEQHR
jgi:hypothetical protein